MHLHCPITPTIDLLFQNADELRTRMVKVLREAREKKGLSQEDLDAAAVLGSDVPSCKTYEADPSKLTSFAIARAQYPLDLYWEQIVGVPSELIERHREILTEALKQDRCEKGMLDPVNDYDPAALEFFTVHRLSDELQVLDHGIGELEHPRA